MLNFTSIMASPLAETPAPLLSTWSAFQDSKLCRIIHAQLCIVTRQPIISSVLYILLQGPASSSIAIMQHDVRSYSIVILYYLWLQIRCETIFNKYHLLAIMLQPYAYQTYLSRNEVGKFVTSVFSSQLIVGGIIHAKE